MSVPRLLNSRIPRPWPLFPFALILCATCPAEGKQGLTAQDVVRRHLESVGPERVRLQTTSLALTGQTEMRLIAGGGGWASGPSTLVSQGGKFHLSIVFDLNAYPGDEVVFDGRRVSVSYLHPDRRSELGEFLHQFGREIVEAGLLSGILSTAWPLLDLEGRKAGLTYEGVQKLEGVEYHTLGYRARKGADVRTRLYFDRSTFQHRHSVYTVRLTARIVAEQPGISSSQPEQWYTLTESFQLFRSFEGLTLPTRWSMEFRKEAGPYGKVVRWVTQIREFHSNVDLPADAFSLGSGRKSFRKPSLKEQGFR